MRALVHAGEEGYRTLTSGSPAYHFPHSQDGLGTNTRDYVTVVVVEWTPQSPRGTPVYSFSISPLLESPLYSKTILHHFRF